MVKNKLMGGMKPLAAPPSMKAKPLPMAEMSERGGKMKTSVFGKKAKETAEKVPTGPMKGIK